MHGACTYSKPLASVMTIPFTAAKETVSMARESIDCVDKTSESDDTGALLPVISALDELILLIARGYRHDRQTVRWKENCLCALCVSVFAASAAIQSILYRLLCYCRESSARGCSCRLGPALAGFGLGLARGTKAATLDSLQSPDPTTEAVQARPASRQQNRRRN